MALLTPQPATRDGILAANTAADAAGDSWENGGRTVPRTFLFAARNASAGAITLSFKVVRTIDSANIGTQDVVVGAGEVRIIGPFNEDYEDTVDPSEALVLVNYSAAANLFVDVIDVASGY